MLSSTSATTCSILLLFFQAKWTINHDQGPQQLETVWSKLKTFVIIITTTKFRPLFLYSYSIIRIHILLNVIVRYIFVINFERKVFWWWIRSLWWLRPLCKLASTTTQNLNHFGKPPFPARAHIFVITSEVSLNRTFVDWNVSPAYTNDVHETIQT